EELMAADKLNANPFTPTIGRMMKVSKEDMVALLAAVERFVHLDPQAEWKEWERRLGVIEAALKDVATLQCERIVPLIANHVPHLILTGDEKRWKLTRERITQDLANGDPSIRIGRVGGTGDRGVLISVFVLQEGEDRIVARRLREIFDRAGGS